MKKRMNKMSETDIKDSLSSCHVIWKLPVYYSASVIKVDMVDEVEQFRTGFINFIHLYWTYELNNIHKFTLHLTCNNIPEPMPNYCLLTA